MWKTEGEITMEVAELIPKGETCTGCPFLNYNQADIGSAFLAGKVPEIVGIYCRVRQRQWLSVWGKAKKHEGCPIYDIESLSKEKVTSVRERTS